MSCALKWETVKLQGPTLKASYPNEAGPEDRQDRVPGFSTEIAKQKKVLIVGAAGLGGAIAPAMARKGYGELRICDSDVVELSNMPRQMFYPGDLYQNKALALAKNVARESCFGTVCVGHAVDFGPETADVLSEGIDFAVVGVDSDYVRAFASRYFRRKRLPVIFTAVSDDAGRGWAFVQEVEGPCLGCVFPYLASVDAAHDPCQPSPAAIDVLRLVGALVTFAADTLNMKRERHWNYKGLSLLGDQPDVSDNVRRRKVCGLCGGTEGA